MISNVIKNIKSKEELSQVDDKNNLISKLKRIDSNDDSNPGNFSKPIVKAEDSNK